jgi:dihydroflavonol-4-reductase
MKTLVTGANGLLGANVVRELEARGREVRVMVRPKAALTALLDTDAELVHGDILDPGSLDRAVKGCDAVVHAAANTRQWPVNYEFYEPVNVTGTQNVMEACRRNNVGRIVYVSTANTFGPGTREDPGTELSEFSGFRLGSGYITSKFVAQQNVLSEIEKHGTPVVIVNPAFMIGPFDARPSSGKIIFMGLSGRIQFRPAGGKNFIHAGDAAIGVCNALERGRVGECYLLANENLSYSEFFDILNRVAGRQPWRLVLPTPVIRAGGLFGSISEKITGQPARLNRVNAGLLTLGNYYSGRKAVTELGLPQKPVVTAISDAIGWFRRNNML